jgi:hypothetical protein
MTDTLSGPADITPGMVALLWGMHGNHLVDVFKELVRRQDIDSLQVVLSSDTLQKHAWADLPFHLLPLKESDDPRARQLYAEWSAKMAGTDPAKLAQRLLHLASFNDRVPEVRVGLLSEISQIMSLGGDIEAPIGASKRTPLGEAINNLSFHSARHMISEFAKRHPGRLPAAMKGKDVISFLIMNELGKFSTTELFDELGTSFDFSKESLKVGPSKAIIRLAGLEKGKPSSNESFGNILKLVELGMVNAEAMRSLWNMPGTDQFDPAATFFLSMTKYSGTRDEAGAIAALNKFLESGIDINAPFSDGRRPVEHALAFGEEGFFVAVLEAGVDLRALHADMQARPGAFAKALPERVAMANAMLARQQVMNVVNAARQPQLA